MIILFVGAEINDMLRDYGLIKIIVRKRKIRRDAKIQAKIREK